MHHPISRNGVEVTAFHHGFFWCSFRYRARGIAVLSFCLRTSTSESWSRKGVERTMVEYKEGKRASRSVAIEPLMPGVIFANSLMSEKERLRVPSWATSVLAVYSLGILRAIINPTTAPMPHTFRSSLLEAHIFRNSSSQSIFCFSFMHFS